MKIFASNIQFLAFHGITEPERTLGHRLRLDLVAETEPGASTSDSIDETVDYAKMTTLAVEACTAGRWNTLEFACEKIGHVLLERFPLIETVTVTLSKLHPLLPLTVEAVGVEKRFSRVRD